MTMLSDAAIRERVHAAGLIIPFEPKGLGGASYELRCSSTYYDLTEDAIRIESKLHNNKILIKPKHTVALITEESLQIPQDLTAHIISKGSLFSIGLSPVCTYADPGFSGQLGLVTTNNSDKYITLDALQSVAKIHFTELTSPATKLYKGQHGFKTELWPIRKDLQKDHSQIKSDKRVKSEEQEAFTILPRHTSLALEKIRTQNTKILVALVIAFGMNALLFYSISKQYNIDSVAGIAINLISSAILGIFAVANQMNKR